MRGQKAAFTLFLFFFNHILYPLCMSFAFVEAFLCSPSSLSVLFWFVLALKLMLSVLICHNLFCFFFSRFFLSFFNSFSSSLPR